MSDRPLIHSNSLMDVARVYGVLASPKAGHQVPAWLERMRTTQPTMADLQTVAEAWALHDPDYLDELIILPFDFGAEAFADEILFDVADIANVARYRVSNGVAEKWEETRAKLAL